MSDDLDERPTPDMGYPVQSPRNGRPRLRTPAHGVPVVELVERPSRRMRSRSDSEEQDSGDSAAADEVESVLHASIRTLVRAEVERDIKRRLRWLWRAVGGALATAVGVLIAFFGRMLDGREQDGIQKQRMHYLEQEVRRIRDGRPQTLLDRDETPSPPPPPQTAPSISAAPPRKDPS